MYWLPDLQVWGTLVSGSPTLQDSDFTESGLAEERVLAKPGNHGNTVVIGDVNGNGVCNVVDAQIVYDIARGVYKFDASSDVKNWLMADVNGNKSIDSLDALALQRVVIYGSSDALYSTTTSQSECTHDYVSVTYYKTSSVGRNFYQLDRAKDEQGNFYYCAIMIAGRTIDLVAEEGLAEIEYGDDYLLNMLVNLVSHVAYAYDTYSSGKTEKAMSSLYSSLYYYFGVAGLEYADCPESDYDTYRAKWSDSIDEGGDSTFGCRDHFEEVRHYFRVLKAHGVDIPTMFQYLADNPDSDCNGWGTIGTCLFDGSTNAFYIAQGEAKGAVAPYKYATLYNYGGEWADEVCSKCGCVYSSTW